MKKYILTLLLISFISTTSSFAQSGPSSTGSTGTGATQTGGTTGGINCSDPENYYNSACHGASQQPQGTSGTGSTRTDGPQGTSGGDTSGQGTFGVYGQIGTGPVNSNGPSTPTTSAPSPQSSAAALTSCSAIKFKSLLDILIWVRCIIGAAIIPLIFGLAFVVFLWGIFRFMAASAQSKDKEEAKKFILWGLIGLFVMVSVWGIIKILGDTLGFQTGVPYLQTKYLDANNASK